MDKGVIKVIVILYLMLCGWEIFAATYYVSPTGSDGNPGTYAQPWQSLVYAIEDNGVLADGDTIIFLAGNTYPAVTEIIDHTTPNVTITIDTNLSCGDVVIDMANFRFDFETGGAGSLLKGIVFDNIYEVRVMANNCSLISNRFNTTGANGIYISSAAANCMVIHNEINNPPTDGIYILSGSGNHIIKNNDINNATVGMDIDDGNHIIISNKIRFCSDDGLDIAGGNQIIKYNEIYNISLKGIDISAGDQEIKYNRIYSLSDEAIEGDGTGAFIIVGNIISNSVPVAVSALDINSTAGHTISSNHITGFKEGIDIRVDGSGAEIIGNIIYNNTGYGIWNNYSDMVVANNVFHHNLRGFHSSGGANNILKNNICYQNTHSGIYLFSSSDVDTVIINNISYLNGSFGFGYNAGVNIRFVCNLAFWNKHGFYCKESGNGANLCVFYRNTSCFNTNSGFLTSGTPGGYQTCVFSNNVTYGNNVGFQAQQGNTVLNYSCINDGYSNNWVSLGAGSITNDPYIKSGVPGSENFNLKWNSPAIDRAAPNPVKTSMGRWTAQVITTNSNVGKSSRYIISFYNESETPILNNAIITLKFSLGGNASVFGLGALSGASTTSPWGGAGTSFSVSGSDIDQTVSLTRTSGSSSHPFQSENIILDNVINSMTQASNYRIEIVIYSNNGRKIMTTTANDFKLQGVFTCPEVGITGFSPSEGNPGDTVSISGTGFWSFFSNSRVLFNGQEVTNYISWNATNIIVLVPYGVTTGPIQVTNHCLNGDISLTDFTVTSENIFITGFSPSAGCIGYTVVITGTNFMDTRGNGGVYFNGVPALTYVKWDNNSIEVVVPSGVSTGPVSVTNHFTYGATTVSNFNISMPVINSFSPSSGCGGDTLHITGSGFLNNQNSGMVRINGVSVDIYNSWSDTNIVVVVPWDASTGHISITNDCGNGVVSLSDYTVTTLKLKIKKSSNKTNAAVGEVVTYRITIENTNSCVASLVKVSERIPYGVHYETNTLRVGSLGSDYDSASQLSDDEYDDQGSSRNGIVIFCITNGTAPDQGGYLAPGQGAALFFKVKIAAVNYGPPVTNQVMIQNTDGNFDGYIIQAGAVVADESLKVGDVVLTNFDFTPGPTQVTDIYLTAGDRDHNCVNGNDYDDYFNYFYIGNRNENNHAYLIFGLGGVPASGLITSATLFLNVNNVNSSPEYPIHFDHIHYSNNYSATGDLNDRYLCQNTRWIIHTNFYEFASISTGGIEIPCTVPVQYAHQNPKPYRRGF